MPRQLTKYLPFLQEYIYEILKRGINLRLAAVYGSIVTDELSPTSDIDIKICVASRAEVKEIARIERAINEKILAAGYRNFIHSLITTKPDPEYLDVGVLLYGRPIVLTAKGEELKGNIIITYDTTPISQDMRSRLAIRLFGHKLKRCVGKKLKIYRTEGVLSRYGGRRLRNAILINIADAEKITALLEKFNVPYKTSRVYTEKLAAFLERS